ncbi:MAG: phosphodiester glycosidase family protein [Oscillospiraceae bacterium]|nr:phosphodiester glycosidase family protein [Oscillospiraceae bacterium]
MRENVNAIENNVPKKKNGGKIVGRIFIVLGLVILFLLFFILGTITVVFRGPSETAKGLLATTLMETSAMKFVPRMYFSEEEVELLLKKNSAVAVDEITDTSLVVIEKKEESSEEIKPEENIEIIDISSSTYKGKLMIVKDPSKVKVSVSAENFGDGKGMKIDEHVEKEGAIAGVNAGGFADENGMGNGGQPLGLVIKDGRVVSGLETYSCVIGLDKDDKLVVGNMKGTEAVERGLRDAVSFGPVYIVNGKRSEVIGTGGGVNPRTCIGQRADGAVLLLTIDGRQATSLGATHSDCIDILEEYGAVNAANLDGGSSTSMYYDGEIQNVPATVYGPRDIPTAFVVMP